VRAARRLGATAADRAETGTDRDRRVWDADAAADRAAGVGLGVRGADWARWSGAATRWDVEAAADRAVGRGARMN
jgi:hypothetical protein